MNFTAGAFSNRLVHVVAMLGRSEWKAVVVPLQTPDLALAVDDRAIVHSQHGLVTKELNSSELEAAVGFSMGEASRRTTGPACALIS